MNIRPMTETEIDRLKIWTEKQAERRPNEILYQDILRLILTIEILQMRITSIMKMSEKAFRQSSQNPNWHWFAGSDITQPCGVCGNSVTDKVHDQPTMTWDQIPHRFKGIVSLGRCILCEQPPDAMIHDQNYPLFNPEPKESQPEIDPQIQCVTDQLAGELEPALKAIRPNLDPGMQNLIDQLLEGLCK